MYQSCIFVFFFLNLTFPKCGLLSLSIPSTFAFLAFYEQEFLRSSRARRRYWARSYAGWRRFNAAQPSAAHTALSSLEKAGRINLMITQNVDRY